MHFHKLLPLLAVAIVSSWIAPSHAEDYYATLGVPRDAGLPELKKAYRALSLKYHPDKNPGNVESATQKFQAVSEAYGILSDPAKRRVYDTVGSEGLKHAGDNWHERGASEQFVDPFQMFKEFFGDGFSFSFSASSSERGGQRQRARKAAPKPIFQPSDPVTILNSANFRAHLSRKARKATVWLAMFHDRDRESAALARTVKKVAARVKGIARVGTIDCTQWPSVCAGQEADFLPSLRVLSHNGSAYFKDTQDVPTIKRALEDALPNWVLHFGNRHTQGEFESAAANGTFDEGVAVLFSADTAPPPVLCAQAARFAPRDTKREQSTTSISFHPRFALVSMPPGGQDGAVHHGIAARLNLTELPQLIMFRPAMNTSRGLPLLSQHYTAGVLGRFSGDLGDGKAMRKWVKGFAGQWTELVVNASRAVSNDTREQLSSALTDQHKAWSTIRTSASEHTLTNITLDSLRSCFDASRAAEIFSGQETRGVKCLLVFSPTKASTAAVDAAVALLQQQLRAARQIPRLRELQLLHVRGKPNKAAKWKTASVSMYAMSAMTALLALDDKVAVQPQLGAAVAAQLGALRRGTEDAESDSGDAELKDALREASRGILAAYSDHMLADLRKGGKGARDAAGGLPGMLLLEVSGAGAWSVCSASAAALVRAADPPRGGKSLFGAMAPRETPHKAVAKRIAAFATDCLQGSLPRHSVPGNTADAIRDLVRWREAQNNDARQFLESMNAAKGAE